MRFLEHKTLVRSIALPVGLALLVGTGASSAQAMPDDPSSSPAAASWPADGPWSAPPPGAGPADPRLDAVLARFHAVPAQAGPAELATAMFPDDDVLRAEALLRLEQVQGAVRAASADTSLKEDPRTEAVPAFILAAVPLISRCVMGALGGAAVDQVVHLVWKHRWQEAEDLIEGALSGCLSAWIFYPPLRRRIANEIVGIVLWIIVHTR